ncbi:hypothetical protein [Streptomyces sp. Qhu_M48]|uniref:hypothetical protein n=1 Tax=Streptomyces sp. Qhu_M48 TaxID=3435889 RepID=UPI003F4FBDA2
MKAHVSAVLAKLGGAQPGGGRHHRDGVTWHLVALFYAVELRPGDPLAVTETGGSTEAVAWRPLAGPVKELSPAAADALSLAGVSGGACA